MLSDIEFRAERRPGLAGGELPFFGDLAGDQCATMPVVRDIVRSELQRRRSVSGAPCRPSDRL
jgi:hypothetical protein